MSIIIVRIMQDIVAATNTKLLPYLQTVNPDIEGINYIPGTPDEITKVLTQWTQSETYEPKKFPLVALIQSFSERKGDSSGIGSIPSMKIVICANSRQEWHTLERYDNTFEPILYPIYEELLRQISYSKKLITSQPDLIPHTKIDWPFWDNGNDSNPFDEIVDAIEIRDLKLNFKTENSNC